MAKRLFYAFGFATLLLMSSLVQLLYSRGIQVYHSQMGTRTVVLALVLDLAGVTFLGAAMYAALRRSWPAAVAPAFLAVALPGAVLVYNRMLLSSIWHNHLHQLGFARWTLMHTSDYDMPAPYWVVFLLWAAWCLFVFRLRRREDKGRGLILPALNIGLLAGAILGCTMMVNLARAAVRREADSRLAPMHAVRQVDGQRPRIVWILMDELAYAQVFDQRPADLQLPTFDKLSHEATIYADARPVIDHTDLAIPSLLSGQKFVALHYSYTDKLSFRRASDQQWQPFDPRQTILGDAERAGWNVSVDGWWNPYCTIFSGMLQQCSWTCYWTFNDDMVPMRPSESVWKNMERSFVYPLRSWDGAPILHARLEENHKVIAQAQADLANDSMDFVFIHVGIPHPPFVFDRHTHREDAHSGHSYLDGLAYADATLNTFLTELQSTPRWNSTTVIVNGDHSWRTALYLTQRGWVPEDYYASHGGRFDDRPMIIVHAPGQTQGLVVTRPTPLLHIHDMLESVLKTGTPGS